MSKPAANPFFETDFFKVMDMSKMMGEFKMPSMSFEPLMAAQRKNIEAMTALSQSIMQSFQSLAQRQAEMVRQNLEDNASIVSSIMSSPTAEEKVLRQAEASKATMEKCIANMREITDTVAKCNYQAMETVSTRMNESLEELRGIIKTGPRAVA